MRRKRPLTDSALVFLQGHASEDGLEAAVGRLVDADMGKEAARLAADQARVQLSAQVLGIANESPKWLLGLFRESPGRLSAVAEKISPLGEPRRQL